MDADNKVQQELNNALFARQKLDGQLQETQMVLSEITSVTEGQVIYKAFGPALVVQEKDEALSVLQKRADFIKTELKSLDSTIESINGKLKRKNIQK